MSSAATVRDGSALYRAVARPWRALTGTRRAPRSGRRGRPIAGFVDRMPLWVRLVVAVLVVVALAQLVTGLAAVGMLRHQLYGRLDGDLRSAARHLGPILLRDAQDGTHHEMSVPELGGPVYAQLVGPDGAVRAVATEERPHRPAYAAADPDTLDAATRASLARAVDSPIEVAGTAGEGSWRVVVEPVTRDGTAIVLAVSLDGQRAVLRYLAAADAAISVVVLVLLGALGFLLVRISLRPLRQVEAVAAAIADGQFGERVPEHDPGTEVGRLGGAVNRMLGHIEQALHEREAAATRARASEERLRRFVADASHELRTPLTSIRGFAELYRQGAAGGTGDVARFMGRIEAESTRMGLLVEDMLLLARLDQQRPLAHAPVDLAAVAADAVHDARAVAPDRTVDLRTAGPAVVDGDEARLRQVVANLLGNALTHTPAGTPVAVRVGPGAGDTVVLEVADRGPGLAPEHAARVFERFYRADAARNRHTGGNGLGLAIVAAIVAAHGGEVALDTAPGAGAAFRVLLPASAQPIG